MDIILLPQIRSCSHLPKNVQPTFQVVDRRNFSPFFGPLKQHLFPGSLVFFGHRSRRRCCCILSLLMLLLSRSPEAGKSEKQQLLV